MTSGNTAACDDDMELIKVGKKKKAEGPQPLSDHILNGKMYKQ